MQEGNNSKSSELVMQRCVSLEVQRPWVRFQWVFDCSEVCFSPSVGSGPGLGFSEGVPCEKGSPLNQFLTVVLNQDILQCWPALLLRPNDAQGLTRIKIKVSFEKKNVNGAPLLTLQPLRDLKFTWPILFISSFIDQFLHY